MAEEKKPEGPDVWSKVIVVLAILILGGFALYLTMEHLSVVIPAIQLSVGIIGAVSFITFFFGFMVYLARMGQEYRLEGIVIMEWGFVMLFGVVLLGGILNFLQRIV